VRISLGEKDFPGRDAIEDKGKIRPEAPSKEI
jgi:hypothetical protein